MNAVSTGAAVARAKEVDVSGARRACDVAAAAFPAWAGLGPSARRELLLKAADALQARADDLVASMISEIGANSRLGWLQFASPTIQNSD